MAEFPMSNCAFMRGGERFLVVSQNDEFLYEVFETEQEAKDWIKDGLQLVKDYQGNPVKIVRQHYIYRYNDIKV